MIRIKLFVLLMGLFCLSISSYAKPALHDPILGPNVYVFEPSMDAAQINGIINTIYNTQRNNEFGTNRYALLFKPGRYSGTVDVKVGYYTHVIGLGKTPDDVVITGAVRTQDRNGNALVNFWRACENLAIIPTLGGINGGIARDENVWAVSQAAPMRRVHIINGSLRLFEFGYSSGGFLANSKVDKQIISGSQQQWFTRNTQFGSWVGGVWNMVFVGSQGGLQGGTYPNPPYTVIPKTPVIQDKPFLYFDTAQNQYAVMVPNLTKESTGPNWEPGKTIPLSQFYIVKPGDTAATINAALLQSKHLLFTPGIYHLEDTIRVFAADTIVLGIGLPTLIPDRGQTAMSVADVDGIKIAGILFDAGATRSPNLLQIGYDFDCRLPHNQNPISLYDVFCRVGGAHPGQATSCVQIDSHDVVGDYFWLWRADHGSNVSWTQNPADTGLIVTGSNVTLYGLMVEHFQKYQTIWKGENGKNYFYQCEIPYDPPSQAAWMNNGVNGYAAYKIADNVNNHQAWGLGVYSYFRDADNIYAHSAIEAPVGRSGIKLTHMVDIWLDGHRNTGIIHIVNNTGATVNGSNMRSNLTTWP